MDNTTYEIEVVQRDQDERLAEVRQAVAAELERVGLHRTVAIAVGESQPGESAPSLTLYFGDPALAGDTELGGRIDDALAAGRVVIPVVNDLSTYTSAVPEALGLINGWEWQEPDPAGRLAKVLLEQLGIEERQRRVFISHKRDDGLLAAEQLHDSLTHMGFVPFIDRFTLRSGEHVQRKIADALESHAFLLLLETPLASTSEWVYDEVDYALSHTMGTLIVRWPGDHDPVPGSLGVPRLVLEDDDLHRDEHGYDVLSEAALDRVLAEVESAHADGLVRRRKMLIRSIEDAAAAAGCSSVPLPDWRLLVHCDSESTMLGITPRLPSAKDLQLLDQARSEAAQGSSAVLVHAARALQDPLREHLRWVAGERELVVMPENAIGGRWTPA